MRVPLLPDKFDPVMRLVLQHFQLDVMGAHGVPHWERVHRNGLLIAEHDYVDMDVLALFAMLHDSMREDDSDDPMHGHRAAKWAEELWCDGELPWLDKYRFTVLKAAIHGHNEGRVLMPARMDNDAKTIQACWDADRLDLPRVGVEPDPRFMGTVYALLPGTPDAHWNEAFDVEYPESKIDPVGA